MNQISWYKPVIPQGGISLRSGEDALIVLVEDDYGSVPFFVNRERWLSSKFRFSGRPSPSIEEFKRWLNDYSKNDLSWKMSRIIRKLVRDIYPRGKDTQLS
jgi:hypothetical protein